MKARMNKKLKNTLLATLCCGLLATAGAGVLTGFNASADSVRVKPTGANTNTLTEAINDADLDTFQVYGASTGKKDLLGFRFLATIEESDLALIPNTAEFGMVIIPNRLLGEGELTVDTANALVAPALVDTAATEVPDGGLGYYITLMGETLEKAFPESLYDTVLTARAYVKYTYTANGTEYTDYIYSATPESRSIAYVASCELTAAEKDGEDVSEMTHLNTIITQTTEEASLTLGAAEIEVGDTTAATLSGATDGVNNYAYNLKSSNEYVAIIENGEIKAVGGGTTTITATIGTKEVSVQLTVKGEKLSVELQAKLLDVWKVPALTFEGGVGELSLQYALQKGGVSYDVLPGDAFKLDKKGEEVKLVVTVTDEIGYARTFTFPLNVDNNVMHFALLDAFDSISVNAGTVLTVPDYVAIDYSQEDVSKNNVEVTIRRGKTQILSVGDEFEVRADSNIYYYAGDELLKTFSIRCLDSFGEDSAVSEQFTASTGVSQINTSILGTVFTLNESNATVVMPYTLSSSGLNVQFSLFDDMLGATVIIKLRALSGQELIYTLTDLGAEPTLYINGEKTYCKVSATKAVYKETDMPEYLNREYYTYSFIVDGAKATLYNGDSLRIASIDKWKDGLLFNGFERGGVQLSFEVKNAKTNGAFVLGKVSNQGLTSVHLGKGEKIAPMIAFDGSFGSVSVKKDSTVVVPKAYVYDVFDPQSSATLTIMSPSGEELLKKAPAEEYAFTASEYGIYYVSYDVRDSKGNRDTLNYLVVVSDDVAPTLTVNGAYKTEYKGSVTILSATATDNVDGDLQVTIWVEKSDKTTREVKAGEKIALEKGSYKIVYYAMDANGNFAVQRFEILVK